MFHLNEIIADEVAKLVREVRERSGAEHWQKTVNTLTGHYNSGFWDRGRARELVRRNVRRAKQDAFIVADVPSIEIATNKLLDELVAQFKIECRHPRRQRQVDEYYCPDCNRRWDVQDEE